MTENTQTISSNTKFLWIGVAIVVLVVGGIWVGVSGTTPSESTPLEANSETIVDLEPAPIAGHPAPDFTLKTLEGQDVTLSDFRGQPVIVNFWATWCGPCRIEMPHLQAAYENNQQEVVVLGVNLTQRDSVEEVPAFLDEFGLTFPIVLDENGEVATTYNVIGQPASVFIDEDGLIHTVFQGPVNEEFINERIDELLTS